MNIKQAEVELVVSSSTGRRRNYSSVQFSKRKAEANVDGIDSRR